MKIKEVCELTGLSERTVRFYMQKGLISPYTHFMNNREYSDFSQSDVELLQSISTLRELSFSISDIQTMQKDAQSISGIVEQRRENAKTEFKESENTYVVLSGLDTSGISSINELAMRARAAALKKPHDVPNKIPAERNNSGLGERSRAVPLEIADKWNWGAFLFPIIWGIANRVYQALWCFIPVVGFLYRFHLGSKGNAFAWKNKYWESVDEFILTQRKWAIWSCSITASLIALYIGLTVIENKQEEKAAIIYEETLEHLHSQLIVSDEWKSVIGDRKEWSSEILASLKEEQKLYLNRKDTFYHYPDAYYQIFNESYYDFGTSQTGIASSGEIIINETDTPIVFHCSVELSNAQYYLFTSRADANTNIISVEYELDVQRTERAQEYLTSSKGAMEDIKKYNQERLEQISAADLWKETIGDEYTVEFLNPASIDYSMVYSGGKVMCSGVDAIIVRNDGKRFQVYILTKYDEENDVLKEEPLVIKELP